MNSSKEKSARISVNNVTLEGDLTLPKDAHFSIQTLRAVENFPVRYVFVKLTSRKILLSTLKL